MKNSRSTDSIRLLALLSLGEVGHHVDLSSQPELKTVILDAFSSSSEEVTPVCLTRKFSRSKCLTCDSSQTTRIYSGDTHLSPVPACVSQVKSAASYALGSIAVGNLPEYLPFVLQEISSSKRQYLLLHSLKEIISKSSLDTL